MRVSSPRNKVSQCSVPPHNETQDEGEGQDEFYFPSDYEGPLDPDYDPYNVTV